MQLNSKRRVEISDNKPGKLLVLSGTNAHPTTDATFQLIPLGIDKIHIEVVQDNS